MKRVCLFIRTFAWLSLFASLPVSAQVPASLETFEPGGSARRLFGSREEVFFSVGASEPCRTPAEDFFADGEYFFQVTDLAGTRLLSTDPVSERRVRIRGGRVVSYAGEFHAVGENMACGSLSVGLMPFEDAGDHEAAYLVWLTPVSSFDGNPEEVDTICGQGCFHGFWPEASRAFAFRVEDKRACPATFCVSGVKFEDRNGNGQRDSGEPGLPGVEIRLLAENGVLLTGITAADGSYRICGLAPGRNYRLFELPPFGFTQRAPVDRRFSKRLVARGFSYFIELCDRDLTGLDFGNQLTPNAIGGVKFEDLNSNGSRDPGEPGLSNVTITLTPSAGGTARTTVTDVGGNFLFTEVAPGSYVLSETVPQGFTQTAPPTGTIPVTLAAGGSSLNNAFGNFRGVITGSISGAKFTDTNGNGARDSGEPGQSGVTITLAGPPGFTPRTAVSGSDGAFAFAGVPLGGYTLSETVPTGFRQTAPPPPGTIAVTLTLAQRNSTGSLFGNQTLAGSVSGLKFNDANGNSVRDAGEAGVAGVTIRLQGPGVGGTTRETVTAADGSFTFSNIAAGVYILTEVVPPGFVQTAPGPTGGFTVSLTAGQNATGFMFGNRAAPATGSIAGTKILDINADGVFNEGDRPFEGIVFVLTDSAGVQRQATSGPDGRFTFANLTPGTYVLSEILPPNFFQTFPGTPAAPGTYTITLSAGQNATGFLFLNKC